MSYFLTSTKLEKSFTEEKRKEIDRAFEKIVNEYKVGYEGAELFLKIHALHSDFYYFPRTPFLQFNVHTWPHIIGLAKQFGWTPEQADYYNNNMRMSEQDAFNLADAISRSLEYIPAGIVHNHINDVFHSPESAEEVAGIIDKLFPSQTKKENEDHIIFFAGLKDLLESFISFCRNGEFRIS